MFTGTVSLPRRWPTTKRTEPIQRYNRTPVRFRAAGRLNADTASDKDSQYVTISYDGTVFLTRSEQLTIHCAFDVGDFPNDFQNCTLTYVAWAHPADEIKLIPQYEPIARISHYQNGTEWELMGYNCRSRLVSYGQVGDWYEVSYYVAFQRKPFYYIISLTVPSFFITNLALIGLFSPSSASQHRSEKTSIGLTALLTMAVILMMVSDLMPKNATSFPKLGVFILWEMAIMAASTITAVCIMYMHSRATLGYPMPRFLRWLLLPRAVLTEANDDLPETKSIPLGERKKQKTESASYLQRLAMDRVGVKLANYGGEDTDSGCSREKGISMDQLDDDQFNIDDDGDDDSSFITQCHKNHKSNKNNNNNKVNQKSRTDESHGNPTNSEDLKELTGFDLFCVNARSITRSSVLNDILSELHVVHRKLGDIWSGLAQMEQRDRMHKTEMAEWIVICYKLDLAMMITALALNALNWYRNFGNDMFEHMEDM